MYCCDRKLGNPYKNVKINIQREKGWDRVRERREGERDEERDSYPLLIILDLNLMSKSQRICPAFPMVSCIVFGYKKNIFFQFNYDTSYSNTRACSFKNKTLKKYFFLEIFQTFRPPPNCVSSKSENVKFVNYPHCLYSPCCDDLVTKFSIGIREKRFYANFFLEKFCFCFHPLERKFFIIILFTLSHTFIDKNS